METTPQTEQMAGALTVLTYPEPALASKSAPVEAIDDEVEALAGRMVDAMLAAQGAGLAAPQVGVHRRIVAVDTSIDKEETPPEPLVLINPEIVDASGEDVDEEGCLSVPGIFTNVARPGRVTVAYMTLAGERETISAEGIMARCFAHEIDHLDGVLFWDRVDRWRKRWLKMKYYKSRGFAG